MPMARAGVQLHDPSPLLRDEVWDAAGLSPPVEAASPLLYGAKARVLGP